MPPVISRPIANANVLSSPKAAAESLTAYFLESGNFFAAGGSMGTQAIAASAIEAPADFEGVGFSGLSVESVGYEHNPSIADENDQSNEPQVPKSPLGIHVYVARGSQSFLRKLPSTIHGIPCTVQNVGKLSVQPELSAVATNQGNLYERNGRVACGSSCAPSGRSYSGTFGALIRKNGSGTVFAISNNHVFADCNHMPIGQPIVAPSGPDSRPGIRAPGQICLHSEITELRSGTPALVSPCREDLAIAEVPDPNLVTSWQGDTAQGYDTPTSLAKLMTGLRVKKWGRTTGLTLGTMQSVQIRTSIPYEGQNFRALVWFQDVWTIQSDNADAFALPGDSGSLVVTEDGKLAVGVLFAVSAKGRIGFIIPMERVTQSFGGISLVNNHGV